MTEFETQRRAEAAIGAACTEWLKAVTEAGLTPYPRSGFHAGAVWMAQQIELRRYLAGAAYGVPAALKEKP